MVSSTARTHFAAQLAQEHLPIAQTVAFSLKSRYPWVPSEDIRSYSLWGLLMAANAYSPDKGVTFPALASPKAIFIAIDRMRKERVLRRRAPASAPKPGPRQELLTTDIHDERSSRPLDALEARDSVGSALRHLPARNRQLLSMYYVDEMTLREIGCPLHICQYYTCIRHQALMVKLHRAAKAIQSKH